MGSGCGLESTGSGCGLGSMGSGCGLESTGSGCGLESTGSAGVAFRVDRSTEATKFELGRLDIHGMHARVASSIFCDDF